eukprot:NODE_1783_length_757_cov_302.666667_g1386_i0.p1 GENE.NODE_1783_length_757_cov_302.666667_g1386_i0~~NODE_1783_length_757_cov_302.666667_g1386_i0.p1  ORF type:complete len:218 (-),score=35.17 NODE_1783_length_757_cov_302.666667_g1386_i0:102-704(-)
MLIVFVSLLAVAGAWPTKPEHGSMDVSYWTMESGTFTTRQWWRAGLGRKSSPIQGGIHFVQEQQTTFYWHDANPGRCETNTTEWGPINPFEGIEDWPVVGGCNNGSGALLQMSASEYVSESMCWSKTDFAISYMEWAKTGKRQEDGPGVLQFSNFKPVLPDTSVFQVPWACKRAQVQQKERLLLIPEAMRMWPHVRHRLR